MSENLSEAISLDQAVERMMGETPANDETPEELTEQEADEAAPETEEPEGEAVETEDEAEPETEAYVELDTETGKVRLTKEQIAEGVMLKADYTRKTMAVAEERKAVEAEKGEVARLKQQLSEALQTWAIPTEQEPDWEQLARTKPPQEVLAAQAQWQKRQRQAQMAREQFSQLRQQQLAETVKAEQEQLFTKVPEWRDPGKYTEAAQTIAKTGQDYGFSLDELSGLVDHRMILVLKDAAAYRALQAVKPETKKVAQAPATLKPGAKTTKTEATQAARQKQREQLKRTGRLEDAVALLFGKS